MSNYSDNTVIDDPNHVWNKLATLIPDKSLVLDIGCSSGNFGEFLIGQKDCVVDGVEPDEKDAGIAKKKLRKVWDFAIDNDSNVAEIGREYDILVFADVLEHLVYPDQTLKLVKKLLKPNGKVVFSVPNMAHISIRLALLEGEFSYTETGILDKTHIHFYDLNSIERLFEQSDMTLSQLDTVVYKYPQSIIKKRLSKIGFSANKVALKILNTPEATAFQYVGSATYDKKAKKHRPLPSTALSKDLQIIVDELDIRRQQVEERDQLLKQKNTDIVDLSNRLKLIEQSHSYAIAQKISAIVRFFLRPFRT